MWSFWVVRYTTISIQDGLIIVTVNTDICLMIFTIVIIGYNFYICFYKHSLYILSLRLKNVMITLFEGFSPFLPDRVRIIKCCKTKCYRENDILWFSLARNRFGYNFQARQNSDPLLWSRLFFILVLSYNFEYFKITEQFSFAFYDDHLGWKMRKNFGLAKFLSENHFKIPTLTMCGIRASAESNNSKAQFVWVRRHSFPSS